MRRAAISFRSLAVAAVLYCPLAACSPGAAERCDVELCGDSIDNDCDGSVDEGCACEHGTIQPCGLGVCAGEQQCEAGEWSACYGDAPSVTDACDGRDDDCDGVVDNGDNACGGSCAIPGAPGLPCDGDDGDACTEGTWDCRGLNDLVCSDTTGTLVELCGDGTDDNCDGRADEYCAARVLAWSDHGGSTVPGARAQARDVAVAADGSVYVVGFHDRAVTFGATITHDAGTSSDAFVLKYSANGALVWHRAVTGPGDATATAIAIDSDGSIVVAGSFGLGGGTATFGPGVTRTSAGGDDGFVARYSPAGDALGVATIASTLDDEIADLAVGPGGKLAITGRFIGPVLVVGSESIPRSNNNWTYFAATLDASLAFTGTHRVEFVAPSRGDIEGHAVAFASNGTLLVGGAVRCFTECQAPRIEVGRGNDPVAFEVGNGFRSGFVAAFDATGTAWAGRAPEVHAIAVTGTDVFVTGAFGGTEPFAVGQPNQTTLVAQGNADTWLARYSTAGELAWAKQFGSPTSCGGFFVGSDDAGLALALDTNGPIVAGTHHEALVLAPDLIRAGDGWGNVYWAGFDGDGTVAWGHNGKIGETPCSGGGTAHGIATAPNGDIVVVGGFNAHLILPTKTLLAPVAFFVTVFTK